MDTQAQDLVVDADGHVCEPADLWTKRLPAHLRARGIRLRWNAETGYDEAYVEDRLLTDRGLVGLGNAGSSFADLGRGIHYEDINRAGFAVTIYPPVAQVFFLAITRLGENVLVMKLGLLAFEAARIADRPTSESVQAMDPRAVSSRSAALGRVDRPPPRGVDPSPPSQGTDGAGNQPEDPT